MSGWAEERKILESWFYTQWQSTTTWNQRTCPIAFEGQLFDPPNDGSPYLQMNFVGQATATQVSLGTPALDRYIGLVQFTINCPIGKTTGANEMIREIADNLDRLWKRRRFMTSNGIIRCRVPALHMLGNINDRYVGVFSVPYLRDEFASTPGDSAPVPLT